MVFLFTLELEHMWAEQPITRQSTFQRVNFPQPHSSSFIVKDYFCYQVLLLQIAVKWIINEGKQGPWWGVACAGCSSWRCWAPGAWVGLSFLLSFFPFQISRWNSMRWGVCKAVLLPFRQDIALLPEQNHHRPSTWACTEQPLPGDLEMCQNSLCA